MPDPLSIIRLAALLVFIGLVAVGLWLLDVAWWVVPPVMALALFIAWTIEWLAWRGTLAPTVIRESAVPAPAPVTPVDEPSLPAEASVPLQPRKPTPVGAGQVPPEAGSTRALATEPPPAAPPPVAAEPPPEPGGTEPDPAEADRTPAPARESPRSPAPPPVAAEPPPEHPGAGHAPLEADSAAAPAREPPSAPAAEPEPPPPPVVAAPPAAEPVGPRARRPRLRRLRPVPASRPEAAAVPPARPEAAAVPPARPALPDTPVVAFPAPTVPRSWNLWDLERIARENARTQPERRDEWSYLFLNLRQFAAADGALPTEFDGLVRESFGGLLERSGV